MGFSQIEETMQNNSVHICPKCGWGYPNHHPSAKQRRAHKKVCGLVLESQDIQEEQCSNIEEEEEEIRDCLVDRQISSKSEEDEYSDAVTEFSESDPRATNAAVTVRVSRVDSKKLEAADLDQKMPVIDFGETDVVSFSAGGIQVEDDCANPSIVDHCIDFNNVEQVNKDLLVPEQAAYTSFEGLHEDTVKGCEEKAQVKSEVSPTTDTGELKTEMGAQDNSTNTHLGFASSDSGETANLNPLRTLDLEKSQQKEAVCTSRTTENVSTGLPEETVKSCEEKAKVKSEVSPTTDTGELTTEIGAPDNSAYTHLGFASSDSGETYNLNPSGTGDLEKSQQKEAVCTSRTTENVSTGFPEETVKGCEERAQVKSEVSPITDTGKLPTEMGAQDSSTYTHLGFASSDSGETANLNPMGTGDLEKSQQKEAVCTSRTIENVSTGQEAVFSEVKDVSLGLELHETVSDPQDNHYDCSRISEKLEIRNVENSVNETDQVEFIDVDGSIKSFTEERKHEFSNGDEVNQKAVDNIMAEELITSAVHSVPCVPTSGKMEDSDVVLGSAADSDLGAEEGKSHMAKQLQSMAVVLLDPVDCPTDNVDDYSSSVTDSIRSPRHAANCLSINATETLSKNAPEALRKEVQVAESEDRSHFEVENLSNTDTLTGSLANNPVAESKKTDTHAAYSLPDTDLQAPEEEAHETESKSTNSVEVLHLNGTGYQSSKEEAQVIESKSTTNGVVNTVIETDSQAQGVRKVETIQSPKKKDEIITEKETIGKLRAPLKSFLLEPNYESKPETKQDFSETSSSLPDKRNINKEWNSPARLPAKRKVRWAPFLCCLPVTTGRTSMVGTD